MARGGRFWADFERENQLGPRGGGSWERCAQLLETGACCTFFPKV